MVRTTLGARQLLVALAAAAALGAAPRAATCAAQDRPGTAGSAIVRLPAFAIRADLRPPLRSLEAGGCGLSLGAELPLGFAVTLVAEAQYMDLADAGASLAALHVGPRYYARRAGIGGLFAGSYAIGLSGERGGERSLALGFLLEAGFAWLPSFLPGLLVEPYLKYPFFFGDEPLVGVAPGLSVGWTF